MTASAAEGFDPAFFGMTCAGVFVVIIILGAVTYLGMARFGRGSQQVRERGIPTVGRILGVRSTGKAASGGADVVMTVEVTPPEGTPYSAPYDAPYEATIREAVSPADLASYQPGVDVPLLMHRDDPTKLTLDARADMAVSSASERR